MTPETGTSRAVLDRECDVFCRYLCDLDATPYVRGKYAAGQVSIPHGPGAPDLLDRSLLAFARRGPWAAGLADAYAARFRRYSLLRQKLVLTFAILENSPALHAPFDFAVSGGRLATMARLGLIGTGWALRSLVAAVIFAPVHVVATLARGGSPRG